MVVHRGMAFVAGAALGAVIASQWKDIARYVQIERMSFGDGNPGGVPATGRHHYPDAPAESTDATPRSG